MVSHNLVMSYCILTRAGPADMFFLKHNEECIVVGAPTSILVNVARASKSAAPWTSNMQNYNDFG